MVNLCLWDCLSSIFLSLKLILLDMYVKDVKQKEFFLKKQVHDQTNCALMQYVNLVPN